MRAFRAAGMDVGICTNATTLDDDRIGELAGLGVHCNVSLDGFAADSHGKFRGDRVSFDVTVATVEKLGAAGILQGLLCTPNSLAQNEEYRRLCEFARENGARMCCSTHWAAWAAGSSRNASSRRRPLHMQEIYELTSPFDGPDLDIAHIRFPNTAGKPLAGCAAGTIIYVFTPGKVTVCPYLVFAARTRSPGTPTLSSSWATSSPTRTSPSAWTTTTSTTATRSARTPPVFRAR